jgi:pseudouridine kinase
MPPLPDDSDALDLDPSPVGMVVVIGSSVLDAVGRPRGALVPRSSVPGAVRISPGGVARNVAENLARLGVPVSLMTAVGDDDTGRQLLEQAAHAGIDISDSLTVPGADSGSYLAILDEKGSLQMALDQTGVVESLTPEVLESHADRLASAQAIFLDANLPPESVSTVVRIASAAGVPVAADPTSVGLARRLLPHLSGLWLITPNEAEAEVLCPHPVPHADRTRALEAARHLVGRGVEIALVTMAEFGVVYATAETSGHVPAVKTEIVDPTGAGDAQTAAVMVGLLSGIPLDESVRLGAAAASLTLRTAGSVAPDLSLEALYDELR